MRKNTLFISALVLLVNACGVQNKEVSWQPLNTIQLDSVNPIGLAFTDEGLWLSDGDRNRLVLIDEDGHIFRTVDSLDRPMHIASHENVLYVPMYGNDIIARIAKKAVLTMPLADSLDAPAGISAYGQERAIADFYNHRILYSADGQNYVAIGKEGKADGEFYYPTDVQITGDRIWVADAYNNRVQVFDKNGIFEKSIGAAQNINAATGIYVSETELFITDFENNRVLVFDHDGNLKQLIEEGVEKPTDILEYEGILYIANYKSGELLLLQQSD
jgi:DNA-binding beta-propeller fold protein YncE